MSDPISRLDQFRADTPGAPMKSAAEVRRRGDQIRRRRRAVAIAGAAAVAAAVAGPIVFFSTGFGDKAIDPAPPAPSQTPTTVTPSPSGSASAAVSDLTRANLPTEKDLVADEPFPRWVEEQTYDGEGSSAHNECLPTSLTDAGALATFRRDFVPEPGSELAASAGTLRAVVAEFESAKEAETVRQELTDAATTCSALDAEIAGYLPVQGGVISTGDVDVVTYRPEDTSVNAVWEVATAVVLSQDRVLVMTRERGAQDYVEPTDLQTSAINAAHRMVGAEPPVEPSSDPPPPPSTSSNAPEPTLAARHLLTGEEAIYPNGGPLDWVESSGSTRSGEAAPAGNACWQGSMKDRGAIAVMQRDFALVTSEGGDSDADAYLNETVAEFSSNEEAQAAYENVLTWFDGCRPEGSESFKPSPFENVPMAAQAEGVLGQAIYGPITAAPGTQYDPAGREEDGWFLEMGVVLSGDRIAVLSQLISGQDYSWPAEDGGTPVRRMLPAAADRIAAE